jgi:hypothetical protein
MLNKLIADELNYFKPMLQRQNSTTQDMRRLWRTETVAQRHERISLETYELCKGKVIYGPFKGLFLNAETWWGRSDLGAQCLGLYELEILDLISNSNPFDVFIDIGAADGYYAVGMLHSQMAKKVICFESSEAGRVAIKKTWKVNNNIGRLEIFAEANQLTIKNIANEFTNKTLVLIDIEGNEFSLLNREIIALLKNCEMIIEIHNWVDNFELKYKNLLTTLNDFFHITLISPIERNTTNLSELRSFTDDNRLLLTSERRPCLMRFLYLAPKFV